jgi:putative DNA primase/helicase
MSSFIDSEPQIVSLRYQQGRTQNAIARSIARRERHRLRYVLGQRKFIVFDGKRWKPDEGPIVDDIIRRTTEDLFTEADVLGDEISARDAAEITTFIKAQNSAQGMAGIKRFLPSDPGIAIAADELDRDTALLNLLNGTVDLREEKLLRHDPSMMLTRLIELEYDRAATCPTWERVLCDVFPDAELRDHIQKLVGYFVTGSVREHKLFIFWGCGANGKSLIVETIRAMLGEYATAGAPDLLMQKGDAHPTEIADLAGRRFVPCMETEENRRLAEARVKLLTGGDTLSARRMKQDFWTFTPQHKLVLCTNHKPELRGTDNGIRRRLHLVPFVRTFTEAEQDKALPNKLRAELPGILAWAVRGAKRWATEGLGEPECVRAATADYIDSQDVIGNFIGESCVTGSWARVRATALYELFDRWCNANGETAISQRRFGQSITERGYQKRTNNGVWYLGIAIRDTDATEGTEGSDPFSG